MPTLHVLTNRWWKCLKTKQHPNKNQRKWKEMKDFDDKQPKVTWRQQHQMDFNLVATINEHRTKKKMAKEMKIYAFTKTQTLVFAHCLHSLFSSFFLLLLSFGCPFVWYLFFDFVCCCLCENALKSCTRIVFLFLDQK